MNEVIEAPWTHDQVVALHERQLTTKLHSYYCDCGDILRPTPEGWFCLECGKITQGWAHSIDFTYWWRYSI